MNQTRETQSTQALPPRPRNLFPVWLAAALAVLWLIVRDLEISFETLVYGVADMGEYFSRYRQPDFSDLSRYLVLMSTTLATALWGTVFALVVAFFLAPLAARNLAPHPLVYRAGRELLNFMRAMPDLLLALIFVAALGLGPLPGALALGVHTAGFLGKFFAESLERVDQGVYEGVASTGANFPQLVMYAGWPSILREALGFTRLHPGPQRAHGLGTRPGRRRRHRAGLARHGQNVRLRQVGGADPGHPGHHFDH